MKLIQKDNIDIILQNTKNTPRMAVCTYFSLDIPEKYAGVYTLFSKLLLKGTKTRSAEDLANIIESNGIETSVKCKQDYIKVSTLFLNEDFDLALDVLSDILQNSTFENFEKEVFKSRGEIVSDLDSPQVKASDALIEKIYENHYSGNSLSKTLNDVDKIQKQDVVDVLSQIMNSKKVISIAGDFNDEEKLVDYIVKKFNFMKSSESVSKISDIPALNLPNRDEIIKIVKNDAKQAQIFKGMIVDTQFSEDYPKIVVMNNILGSSGLSSRLFVELRDKQGLAYTVRSALEPLRHSSLFYFYIGTEPKNIEKSLEGFKIEAGKMAKDYVSDIELSGAKENILGRLEYFSQTNMQLASIAGYDYIMGLGLNYEEKYKEMLNKVTKEDVLNIAQKYLLNPAVISVLAPEEYLKNI